VDSEIKMRVLEIIRAALGAIYLLGAIINLQFALLNPYVYQEFAKFALIVFLQNTGAQS